MRLVRSAALCAAGLALAACTLLPARAVPHDAVPVVHASRVHLDPDRPDRTRVGQVRFLGGLQLRSTDPRFGGLSGARVSADGKRLITVSDRGWWVELDLGLEQGVPARVEAARITPLVDAGGNPLTGSDGDAEALELFPDGSWVVAFERNHRLWRYPEGPASPRALAFDVPADLRKAPWNQGAEAIAALPDRRMVVLTEGAFDHQRRLKGWVGVPGTRWDPIRVTQTGILHPTDLGVLPDGDLLLLERRFTWLGGAGARLSRIPLAALAAGAPIEPEELVELGFDLTIDNMEALAVVPGSDPARFYVLSDDNYSAAQRTLLLVFELTTGQAVAPD